MNTPDVSIIVAAYNYARFLPEALESVLAQSFHRWECIVVDDGSTDDTPAVASRWSERDGRFRVVRQENRGLCAARNTGLQNARGRFVQFLDADDRLLPRKLERHVRYLQEHAETDIVYGEVRYFRTESPDRLMLSLEGRLSSPWLARVHGVEEARSKLDLYNIMPVVAAMVRREVFDRAGAFDEGAPSHEDYALWIRCAVAGCRFDFDDESEPVAAVRSHAQSMSRDSLRMLRGLIHEASAFRVWRPDAELPAIYRLALGVREVEEGRRRVGSAMIREAARRAGERPTALRWWCYWAASLVLPRALFLRAVSHPVPEGVLELYRNLQRAPSDSFRGAAGPSS